MMDKCMKVIVLFSFVLCLFSIVNTQGPENKFKSFREEISSNIFLKNEPIEGDSNEESLKAIHLCIEREDQKERLITCDSYHSPEFACVSSWEGQLQRCDTFNKDTLAAAICVQAKTSHVGICEYKNFKAADLCSRRKQWINSSSDFRRYATTTEGLRSDIRLCQGIDEKKLEICLKRGILLHCDNNGPNVLKESGFNSMNKQLNSNNLMINYKTKIDIEHPLYQQAKLKGSYGEYENHPQRASLNDQKQNYFPGSSTNKNAITSNQTESGIQMVEENLRHNNKVRTNEGVRYMTFNILTGEEDVRHFSIRKGSLSTPKSLGEILESYSDEKQSRIYPHATHNLSVDKDKRKLKYRQNLQRGVLETLSRKENVSAQETAWGKKISNTDKVKSQLKAGVLKIVYQDSTIPTIRKNSSKLKHRSGHKHSYPKLVSGISKHKDSISAHRSTEEKMGSNPDSKKHQIRSFKHKTLHRSRINGKNKRNHTLKHRHVRSPQKDVSELSRSKFRETDNKSILNKRSFNLIDIEPFYKSKEFVSDETGLGFNEKGNFFKELDLIFNKLEFSNELITENTDIKSKEEYVIEDMESNHGNYETDDRELNLENSDVIIGYSKQSRESGIKSYEAEKNSDLLKGVNSQTGEVEGLLYRAPGKRKHKKPSKGEPSETQGNNMFFNVLKCKDCEIVHAMIVDKEAEGVIPEVETWTYKI